MKHLSEEQLALLYYGEPEGRPAAEQHLRECPECRGAFESLRAELDAITAPAEPARSEQYGTEVWNRIRAHLPEREAKRWWFLPPRQAVIWASVAAMIVIAFLAGRHYGPQPNGLPPAPVAAQKEQVRERILLVALGDHLERSQTVLIELANAPATGKVDISSEQRRAEELLDANRLYRQTAIRAGDPRVVQVLDQLERVLLDVAHSPSDISGAQLQQIQRRMEEQGILFKVKVLGSSIKKPRHSAPPATRRDARKS